MLKRLISLLMCCAIVFLGVPAMVIDSSSVSARGYDFDDRIIYGGTAVDIGDDYCYTENGKLWRLNYGEEIPVLIADADAKYINYFDNRLWFVAENTIMSCTEWGRDLRVEKDFGEDEISCLYVVAEGMFYLKGETVYSCSDSSEKALFTRKGIKGFAPLSDGRFKWITENPEYVPMDEASGEIWSDSKPMYLSYAAAAGTSAESDETLEVSQYGNADEVLSTASTYSGPYVQVGDVTLPLENHMPGTFFTKNGRACVCHNTSSNYCIQSVGNCNCMRYYPTGYKSTCEIDLLGAQCFSFARMVFYTCFGFIDHPMNDKLYHSVGSLSSGKVTENSVKNLLMQSKAGAHIRLAAGHSMSVLTMDEDFIVIYHGNAGGDGVASASCVVSTRRYTWEHFARAAAAGILYVNMPNDHPDSEIIPSNKQIGYYKLDDNLNLRAETSTGSESLGILPAGTIVAVTEIDGNWGKIVYDGKEGWISLAYATFYSELGITPAGDTFVKGEDGFLRGIIWKLNLDSFTEHFAKQELIVTDAEGNPLPEGELIGTGCIVKIEVDGVVIDQATVCIAGDLNGNAVLDIGDYLIARRSVLELYELSPAQAAAVDVNGDDLIDAFDYLCMRKYFFDPDPEHFEGFK